MAPNLVTLGLVDAVVISFWISKPNKTKMPIKATEPAKATVVTVVTVDTVTVEITQPLA